VHYDCSYCNQRQDLDKPMFDMSESKRKGGSHVQQTAHWQGMDRGIEQLPVQGRLRQAQSFPAANPACIPTSSPLSVREGWRVKVIVTNLSFDVDKLIAACRNEKDALHRSAVVSF